jgi:transcriptional regulator with XRE-family HTH domain
MELYMIVKDPELIRRLMAAKRPEPMSARNLAKQMGWASHSYVNRILSGKARTVTTDAAVKIAYLLGVPVDLIFVPRESGNAGGNVKGAA